VADLLPSAAGQHDDQRSVDLAQDAFRPAPSWSPRLGLPLSADQPRVGEVRVPAPIEGGEVATDLEHWRLRP
jgi:hypothetical protein